MFKTTKVKIILVVLFCIICMSVTLGVILYKNIEIDKENIDDIRAQENGINNKDITGIKLNGTYNQNDLKIQESKVTREKAEINYCQIIGLKNKIIQDNINQELERIALNFYKEKITDLSKVINISVNMSNTANFANVISFEISYVAKINDDADGFYQGTQGINYDLTTGEKIDIDKLFTLNAPIEDILRRSAYYSLLKNNVEENLSGDLVVSDYGDIEDEVELFIYKYKKGEISNFNFSPKKIYIYYGENDIITIDMKQFSDYIAIYNRYLTNESVFEINNVGLKNLYTLTERNSMNYRYTNYEKGSNYFIDVNIDNTNGQENDVVKKVFEDKRKELEAEIEKVKSISSRDSGNFYILNYYLNINTIKLNSTQQTFIYCEKSGSSYQMTINEFKEKAEPVIIEYNRTDSNEEIPNYVYDFKDALNVQAQSTKEYYNSETGEKIES